jgi:mannose-6-phosphate isomerase
MGTRPSVLRTSFHEKVWGSQRLAPWFPNPPRKIGEVWHELQNPLPILVKFLFTSDRLSVQVHPGDEYAALHESARGKTEMWHVLRADAGAAVALGLREPVSPDRLREITLSGEIERLLAWVPVKRGDTIFVPAGTIHAIGAGVALCEIQQNSDVTYRLYDYGRPRDLHVDKALDVAVAAPYQPPAEIPDGFLAYCPYFAVQELRASPEVHIRPKQDRFELFIALEGAGWFGDRPFRSGQTWHAPPGTEPFTIQADDRARFLRVYVP